MSDRREIEGRVGGRWGEGAVLLHVFGGDSFRAPLPERIAPSATEGRLACIYLNGQGGLDGWALPDERVGVRMAADLARWGSRPATLDCQGRCQTLWHIVAGGRDSPDDGCLTCGAPVAAK